MFVSLYQKFADSTKCEALNKELNSLLHGNKETAKRLIDYEKRCHPGKPENWYLEKVIYDLRRGR